MGRKLPIKAVILSSNVVEIKDAVTGVSTLDCITAKARFDVVIKNNNLVFFTGIDQKLHKSTYLTSTANTWSIGDAAF